MDLTDSVTPLASKAVAFEGLPTGFQRKRPDLAGRGVEFKSFPVEIKADRGKRQVEGWAAIFGNIDGGGDVIVKGAFADTLAEQLPQKLIKYFWQHESGIGMPIQLEEQDQGLWGVFEITDTPDFDKYLAQIDQGVAAHQSIGYSILKSEPRRIGANLAVAGSTPQTVRMLQKLKLYEVSAVYWPMNEMATIAGIKSMLGRKSLWDLAEVLEMIQQLQWALQCGPMLTPGEADVARQLVNAMSGASDGLGLLLRPAEYIPPSPTITALDTVEPDGDEAMGMKAKACKACGGDGKCFKCGGDGMAKSAADPDHLSFNPLLTTLASLAEQLTSYAEKRN